MLYKMVSILLLFLLFLPLGGLTADHFPTSHPIPTILFLHPQTFTVSFFFSYLNLQQDARTNQNKKQTTSKGKLLLTDRGAEKAGFIHLASHPSQVQPVLWWPAWLLLKANGEEQKSSVMHILCLSGVCTLLVWIFLVNRTQQMLIK